MRLDSSPWPLVLLLLVGVSANHVGVKVPKRAAIVKNAELRPRIINEPELPNCTVPMCTGPLAEIYCTGKLIHTSWLFGLQDSCPGDMLRYPPDRVLRAFDKLQYPLKREDFKSFCYDNFVASPYLESAELVDWTDEPQNVRLLKDVTLRNFTRKLNAIWKQLGRKFVPQVMETPDRFPVLAVPNSFVVPGGFFRIYFYWDSYWIVKGLLFSNMTETVRNMLENFAYVIQYHGFIPNSGAIQLTRRSQPPLFTQMVADFFEATNNKTFLNQMAPYVDKELSWWRTNRTTNITLSDGTSHPMFQYKTITDCPRPENYLVDLENGLNGTGDPQYIWGSIASACESGHDFSSRWFAYNGQHARTKFSIRTNDIVPVDLNVFMAWNFKSFSEMLLALGDKEKSQKYQEYATDLRKSIQRVMWHDADGIWYDYDIRDNEHRSRFYPSNVFPLILQEPDPEVAGKVLAYLTKKDILKFRGGIPATLDSFSREQWDFPNGWAPTIHLFVESLRRSGHQGLVDVAKEVANNFIRTVYNGLMNPLEGVPSACWEKYDIRFDDGRPGIGGEYAVQQGFGWTNGAVLDMIYRFHIQSPNETSRKSQLRNYGKGPLETENWRSNLATPAARYLDLPRCVSFMLLVLLSCSVVFAWFVCRRPTRQSRTRMSFRDISGEPEESRLISDDE